MSNPTLLKKASLKQLENEVNKRKQTKINELKNKKDIIDQTIKILSGSVSTAVDQISTSANKSTKIRKGMRKNRAVNDRSLIDRLITIAGDGEPHKTSEFITALENSGWKSTSANPYYVVAAALAAQTKKNVFRRVNKGSYTLNKLIAAPVPENNLEDDMNKW